MQLFVWWQEALETHQKTKTIICIIISKTCQRIITRGNQLLSLTLRPVWGAAGSAAVWPPPVHWTPPPALPLSPQCLDLKIKTSHSVYTRGCLKIKSIILDHLSHPGEIRVGRSKRASPIPVSERKSLALLMWLTWQNESQDTVKDFVLVPYPLEELPLTGRIH